MQTTSRTVTLGLHEDKVETAPVATGPVRGSLIKLSLVSERRARSFLLV